MLTWLKKLFVPHEGNDHRPHFLHGENVRTFVVALLIIEGLVFVGPTFTNFTNTHFLASVLPAILDDLTNQNRANDGLTALVENPLLDKAAQLKADDMAQNSYFAHVSPTGLTPWYWLKQAGYSYDYAGENLAVNFTDSKDVAVAWMNSPTHRANILKASYTEVGTGVATGTYEGKSAIFVVQDFGHPIPNVATVAPTALSVRPTVATATSTLAVAAATTSATTSGNVLGAEVTIAVITPSFWDKLMASPRHTVDVILDILLLLVVVAFVLNIFIRLDIQHPDLITNGLGLIVVIVALYLGNYFISHDGASVITTSFDSTSSTQ